MRWWDWYWGASAVTGASALVDIVFAGAVALDAGVTLTRASSGTHTDNAGAIQVVGNNTPRFDHVLM